MTTFVETSCCVCGIEFCVPAHYLTARKADAKGFHCPNGHSLSYNESDADKLRRERDRLTQRLAQKDDEIARQRELRETAERQAAAA